MDTLMTHGLAFLVGAATGAAGTYLADRFTDQRRRKEAERSAQRQFAEVVALMPDLIREMKIDLSVPENATCRDFFVIPEKTVLCASVGTLFYEDDGKNAYLSKVRILESQGFVIDITPGNAPMFRMQEHFVRALKNA